MSGRLARLLLGSALVVAWLLSSAVVSLAHANLVKSEPAHNSVLDAPPEALHLWFSEAPELRFSEVKLLDSAAKPVAALGPLRLDEHDPSELTISVEPLPEGVYTIAWRVTSAIDGHVTAGAIVFVVGHDQELAGGVPSASATQSVVSGPTPLGVFGRGLGYLGIALLIGGFAFYPLILRPTLRRIRVDPAPAVENSEGEPDAHPGERNGGLLAPPFLGGSTNPIKVGVAMAALATVLSAVIQAASAAGVDVLGAIGQPLAMLMLNTRAGLLLLARLGLLVCIVGLLVYAGRKTARSPVVLAWVGVGLAALAASTISLSSHAASSKPPLSNTVADWLHLMAAGVWIGGLVALVSTLARVSRLPAGSAPSLVAQLIGRFSQVATVCVATIGLTGVYRAVVEVGDLPSLFDTPYGQTLIIKLLLLVPILGLAATNLLLIRRRLGQAVVAPDPMSAYLPWHTRIRQSAGGEVLLLSAVLLATSILTITPPAREAYGTGMVLRGSGSDVSAVLVVSPGEVGLNTFDTYLRDSTGRPVDDALKVALIFTAVTMDMGEAEAEARKADSGRYVAQGAYLSMAESWRVQLLVRRPGKADERIPFTVKVDAPEREHERPPDPAMLARGRRVYEANCAMCHGPTGRGDGPAARTLQPRPADFRAHRSMGHDTKEIFDFISNGIPPAMPSYKGQLSEQERWDVVSYILNLSE